MASLYSQSKSADRKDAALFKELDQYSKPLRDSAVEMADFLISLENKTNEIIELINALQEMKSISIQKIDTEINSIKNAFLKINLHVEKQAAFIRSLTEETLTTMLKKQEDFNNKAVLLVEKAFEIKDKDKH